MLGTAQCLLFFFSSLTIAHGIPYGTKIVNGTDALPGEYPYAVSVRYYDMHECGGSIIGDRWILTAGHCIYTSLSYNASILYGTVHLQNGESPKGHTAKVARLHQHENYLGLEPSYENDIGLIELVEPLIFNNEVQPIELVNACNGTPSGKVGTLVGWGFQKTNGTVMETLQKVNLTVYSEEDCYQAHDGVTISSVHICAGIPEGGQGQCTGDSGGPLTVGSVQYGVVSWSVKPCASPGFPGVFTRISNYRQWIYDISGI